MLVPVKEDQNNAYFISRTDKIKWNKKWSKMSQ